MGSDARRASGPARHRVMCRIRMWRWQVRRRRCFSILHIPSGCRCHAIAPRAGGPVASSSAACSSAADAEAVNRIYAARHMVTVPPGILSGRSGDSRAITYFVAEGRSDRGRIIGTVTGSRSFPCLRRSGGTVRRFWCLARFDPQAMPPRIGEVGWSAISPSISRHAARPSMDLSVMHDNEHAIALYEKLGFERVPFFTLKRKELHQRETSSPVPGPEAELNPMPDLIIDEARRRGIDVEVTDAEGGFFRLFLRRALDPLPRVHSAN